MIRAQAIVLIYLACSVYGQTQTQRARGTLPLATLNSFCPCSVRQFCSNIFEGEDAIFTEILQSIPACPLDQVRCCTKNSMFTAITTIVNDEATSSQGRSGFSTGAPGQSARSDFTTRQQSQSAFFTGVPGQSAPGDFTTRQQSPSAFSTGVPGQSVRGDFTTRQQSQSAFSSGVPVQSARGDFGTRQQSQSAFSSGVPGQSARADFAARQSQASLSSATSLPSATSNAPSFLPRVEPSLQSDLSTLGADSRSINGLVQFLDPSNTPAVHTGARLSTSPSVASAGLNRGQGVSAAGTQQSVLGGFVSGQGRTSNGQDVFRTGQQFSQSNLLSRQTGRVASDDQLRCVPTSSCAESDIYGRRPEHFEQFGFITEQRCASTAGTVLCVVDQEDGHPVFDQQPPVFNSPTNPSNPTSGTTHIPTQTPVFSTLSSDGSVPVQAAGPVAPSVQIIGPAPVYITHSNVQGPSVGDNGNLLDDGVVSSSNQPGNIQDARINALLKSLRSKLSNILHT